MNTFRCYTLLALILTSISTLTHGGSGQKVLLLVKSGGNQNIADLWKTVGGINDWFGNGSSEHITSLLPVSTFRSKEIENLQSDPPQKIYFQALDSQGNVIWETSFLTSNSNFSDLFTLLVADDIDGQSSYFSPADVGIYWSGPEHQMAIHPQIDLKSTYFSIYGNPNSQNYPLFLFPRRKDSPQRLQEGVPGEYDYYGCYQLLHMNMTKVISHAATMNVSICAVACTPTAGPFLGIEYNQNCHCGGFSTSYKSYDMGVAYCNTYTCVGTQDLCGGPLGYYAVYAAILLPIPAVEPAIPQTKSYISIPYRYVPDIPVDLTQYASLPVYINSITLTVGVIPGQYQVHYSQVHPCDFTNKKTVMDLSQKFVKKFTLANVRFVGKVEASCLWIEIVEPVNIPNGTLGALRIGHIDPNEVFVSAPYIAVVGEGFAETTTVEATTTVEVTTTITTTAEATTTEATQTITAESQSTTTMTSGHANTQLMTTVGDSGHTTNHQTSADTSTRLTSHVIPSGDVCMCTCHQGPFNMTREELMRRLKELRKQLSVNVTQLSSYIRKFISAPDNRPSAVGIGTLGVVILTSVFVAIILFDLTRFLKLKK